MKLTLDGLSVEGIKTAIYLLDTKVREMLANAHLRNAANLTRWRVEASAEVCLKMQEAFAQAAAAGRDNAAKSCEQDKHGWRFLGGSESNAGNSHHVYICRKCGLFRVMGVVSGEKERLPFKVEFQLSSPQSVEAAGKFLHLLESEETKAV